ncbi:hypothetical protein HDU76_008980 [Blyttiomyces sp. JEL0837]|nr:hypothetical protein HDU76_008980 [Blyttiomyces sp. JEL0837]
MLLREFIRLTITKVEVIISTITVILTLGIQDRTRPGSIQNVPIPQHISRPTQNTSPSQHSSDVYIPSSLDPILKTTIETPSATLQRYSDNDKAKPTASTSTNVNQQNASCERTVERSHVSSSSHHISNNNAIDNNFFNNNTNQSESCYRVDDRSHVLRIDFSDPLAEVQKRDAFERRLDEVKTLSVKLHSMLKQLRTTLERNRNSSKFAFTKLDELELLGYKIVDNSEALNEFWTRR